MPAAKLGRKATRKPVKHDWRKSKPVGSLEDLGSPTHPSFLSIIHPIHPNDLCRDGNSNPAP
jgi:hypothetical protein